jgi:hypothetical protein
MRRLYYAPLVSLAPPYRYAELEEAHAESTDARAAKVDSLQEIINDEGPKGVHCGRHLAWLSTHLKSKKEGYEERRAAASFNRLKRKRTEGNKDFPKEKSR